MPESTLTDLDELVLTVRNRNSRDYITEAVNDYRVRSLRSAIAATWVAVSYDIISKIRELAQQGDAEAVKFATDLDQAISYRISSPSDCKKRLQAIEGQLLTLAHGKFEFLSDQEFRDMERLYEDRNLCAHPALSGEDVLFQPVPELVRTHIVQAIYHLLQHPPVQGKSALARLKTDLLQSSFPTNQAAVNSFLESRYFKHVKAALLDNIVTILLKAIIKQSDRDLIGRETALFMTLIAVSIKHSDRFAKQMRHDFPRICDGVNEDYLKRAMRLFEVDRRCWGWLDTASQLRITEIVKNYEFKKGDVESVACALDVDELRPLFASCVDQFSSTSDKQAVYAVRPHEAFIPGAIDDYLNVKSWADAEELFEYSIRPFVGAFRSEHIREIVDGARENHEIWQARRTPAQLSFLFERSVDLLDAPMQTSWQEYLMKISGYDKLPRYADLQSKMAAAHIWPIQQTDSSAPPSGIGT